MTYLQHDSSPLQGHNSRRPILASSRLLVGAALLVGLSTWSSAHAQRQIKIGSQAGGTLAWVLYGIEYFGIDKELGLDVRSQDFASKDATRIALRSGDAQVVVDDFLEVTLLRQKNFNVTAVYPFSLLTGGIVVPANSGIRTVADLKGKTIGVTSLTDKTLLILRAYTRNKFGFDPQTDSKVVSASSPLIGQLLDRGEINAGIPFWHHGARLTATGKYRQVISSGELLRGLGLPANIPLLYIVARNDTDPETLRLFIKAVRVATDRMKADTGPFWNSLLEKGLYSLPDRTQLPALRRQWEAGVPKSWSSKDLNNTLLLTRKMIEVAGADVVGIQRLDTRAFNTSFRP
ncbi:ABC transporter substrate-binding protein [Deinococcus yavapaiensis]|uniref:NitT/TauT family transport system substrate-binding protein n=1 Tax=Deinococcus yavapaiensis KR-236 TaxID=694435 RepID=A0A318SL43_9DEIO|nr:ABC transporter substrate-binding protein [Deinococcus yavapaiensis]PYE53272.1 NitT/TauT family transport system substrate-binding protein [Deinococcus yavapaiensis KR-236]